MTLGRRCTVTPCADPECPGTGVPEQDAELYYLACDTCGHEWGWRITPPSDWPENTAGCPVGIPEAVRRRAQPASAKTTGTRVLLQIGRRP